ncbi:MAG: glycosyltransferase family 2 protein [Nitrospinae bacterium]|nr:glycosyltransferase family 2 protein [Nitrospinota bacterium]
MKLSVIVPLLNESENLPELYKRLTSVITKEFSDFDREIVFIDDGSSDNSYSIIEGFQTNDSCIKSIQLSRNFGHHNAVAAGIDNVDGDFIVVMDADLQDRPEDIPPLYKKLSEGFDVVYGVKEHNNTTLFKTIASKIFWWLLGKISEQEINANQSSLRIFTKPVLKALQKIKESNRFYAALFCWVGFKQTSVKVEHDKRHQGSSKYSFLKLFTLAINAIIGFSNKPLYFIFLSGIFILFLSLMFFFLLLSGFNNPLLSLFSLITGGLILVSLGTVGIYVERLFQQSLNRPLYIIKKKSGFDVP